MAKATALAAAIVLGIGCAKPRIIEVPVKVEIPVPIPCPEPPVITEPSLAIYSLSKESTPDQLVKACMASIEQLKDYSGRLKRALDSYRREMKK